MRKCVYSGCSNNTSFICDCSGNEYFCRDHLADHCTSEGDHKINQTSIRVRNEEYENLLKNYKMIKKDLNQCIIHAQKQSKDLIDFITVKTSEYFRKIKERLNFIKNIIRCHISNSSIEKERIKEIERFIKLKHKVPLPKIEIIMKYFSDGLQIPKNNEFESKYIFYSKNRTNNAIIYNLDDKKQLNNKTVNVYCLNSCAAVLIGDNKYFIHGGYSVNGPPNGDTKIVDLNKNEIITYMGVLFQFITQEDVCYMMKYIFFVQI